MTKDIRVFPRPTGNPEIQYSGSAHSSIKFEVLESGSISFSGASGSLFSISDSLIGSLFSVNDISGLPVIEAFSDNRVVMGTFGQNTLVVTASRVGIGTSTPDTTMHIHLDSTADYLRVNNSSDVTIANLGSGGGNAGEFGLYDSAGALQVILRTESTSYFTGGFVGIGTNNPLVNLQIESTGAGSINIVGGTAQYQGVYFGETGAIDGSIRYEPNVNYLSL